MSAKVIDGKAFAAKLRAQIETETAALKRDHGLTPGLATVLVGNDPASEVYIRNKNKTAEAIGFKSVHHHLPESASEAEVLAQVKALNADESVHGILVQMPLPKQVREAAVLDTLDPAKDVDALTPTNAGLLLSGRAQLVSCTPSGVTMLLNRIYRRHRGHGCACDRPFAAVRKACGAVASGRQRDGDNGAFEDTRSSRRRAPCRYSRRCDSASPNLWKAIG
ncbi:MAG: tetrahydrofolate dehydrogenase/cyclohydrolase catalytic domain-containing protein [Rhizomicrobium sp.]